MPSEPWEELGLDGARAPAWKAIGFAPFEGALASGDGFTPGNAVHHRRQLHRLARTWNRSGLGTAEGLRWHRAGFTAPEARRWRSNGVDLESARLVRAGWRCRPVRAKPRREPRTRQDEEG